MSNQLWATLGLSWDYYTAAGIDFYSINPDPDGTVPDGTPASEYCLRGGRTPADCYVRASTESHASFETFFAYAQTREWMGEDWQVADIYMPHMSAHTYEFVWVNTHASEGWSIVSSDQAQSLVGGGIVMLGSGCSVGRFSQPGHNPHISGGYAHESLLVSYVYGSSNFIAATGAGFNRCWEPVFGELVALAHSEPYLGRAYRPNRRHNGMSQVEILVGDPFLDFQSASITNWWNASDAVVGPASVHQFTALQWNAALEPGASTTFGFCASGTGTPSVTETSATASSPASNVSAALSITNDWGTGYCAELALTNGGSAPTAGWRVLLDVGQSTLTASWNLEDAVGALSPTVHELAPKDYNAVIWPGLSASLGWCANQTGSAWMPEVVSITSW